MPCVWAHSYRRKTHSSMSWPLFKVCCNLSEWAVWLYICFQLMSCAFIYVSNYEACTKKMMLACGINGCTKHHHHTLQKSTTPYIAGINALNAENVDTVLLSLQEISTPSGNINCFFHDGSNRCLILESAVKRLGWWRHYHENPYHHWRQKESYTKVFSINLLDVNNETHTI